MITEWHNCYEDGWQGDKNNPMICPEAFAHPAKMARGLLRRILQHAQGNDWIHSGDLILDPFGGIGSTGILSAYDGYPVICVELEPEFCRLTNGYDCPGLSNKEWVRWYNRFRKNPDICPGCHQKAQDWYEKNTSIIPSQEPHHFTGNFELHRTKWDKLGCPQPIMVQGDSRELCKILSHCDGIVTSPPYSHSKPDHWTEADRGDYDEKVKRGQVRGHISGKTNAKREPTHYGTSPGQLGAMKPGDVDAVVTSPPHTPEGLGHGGKPTRRAGRSDDTNLDAMQRGYGHSPGNLGNLRPGHVDGVITSPPYEGSMNTVGHGLDLSKTKRDGDTRHWKSNKYLDVYKYGNAEGQLGNQQGQTFWQAARIILEQCYRILKPGGVAIFVTKAFVRNKKRVDFPGQWRRLCEAVGFVTMCEHHAMIKKERRHPSLFGDTILQRKMSNAFFRKIYESKTAWQNYWATLDEGQQSYWLEQATKKGKSQKKILRDAQELAFKASGEDEHDWNKAVRIDYENVLCMRKPARESG